MNLEQAKQIPIQKLVEELGGRYSHIDRKGDHWYFSPFRPDEKTASFKIDDRLNKWHDFGLSKTVLHRKPSDKQGSGGDITDLWCDYNFEDRRLGLPKVLQALDKLNLVPVSQEYLQQPQRKEKAPVQNQQPRYKILKISDRITFFGLKEELERRKISLKLAEMYLKQGYILDTITGKKYNGFLFENDKLGYEVSIPNPAKLECFKTCICSKASTRVLTSNPNTRSIDIFEGFWDFLTRMEIRGKLLSANHSYVLNSTSMVTETCEKIMTFKDTVKYVYLFMDNDEAGYQATHAIAEQLSENFNVGGMEFLYDGYKDLSEFWMKKNRLIP